MGVGWGTSVQCCCCLDHPEARQHRFHWMTTRRPPARAVSSWLLPLARRASPLATPLLLLLLSGPSRRRPCCSISSLASRLLGCNRRRPRGFGCCSRGLFGFGVAGSIDRIETEFEMKAHSTTTQCSCTHANSAPRRRSELLLGISRCALAKPRGRGGQRSSPEERSLGAQGSQSKSKGLCNGLAPN